MCEVWHEHRKRLVGGAAGMEGTLVEVEAAIGGGLPRTVLVGLPDTRSTRRGTAAGRLWPVLVWPGRISC
jgi:hypothetical protein